MSSHDSYAVSVRIIGPGYRRLFSGFGSAEGCMDEALSIERRLCREAHESFRMVAPGVWESDHVRLVVERWRHRSIPPLVPMGKWEDAFGRFKDSLERAKRPLLFGRR